MADGSTFYNTWSSEDGRDRAWYLLRKTIEEAEHTYDLILEGRVRIDDANAQYRITFSDEFQRVGFFVSFKELADMLPNELITKLCWPTIRDLVYEGVSQAGRSRWDIELEFDAKKFRDAIIDNIRQAKKIADESKRSFVIVDVFPEQRVAVIACSETITKPLEQYGRINKTPKGWGFHVSHSYDFDSVMDVLRAIETADDCVLEYLRSLWLK